jgi:hypothetical protein
MSAESCRLCKAALLPPGRCHFVRGAAMRWARHRTPAGCCIAYGAFAGHHFTGILRVLSTVPAAMLSRAVLLPAAARFMSSMVRRCWLSWAGVYWLLASAVLGAGGLMLIPCPCLSPESPETKGIDSAFG